MKRENIFMFYELLFLLPYTYTHTHSSAPIQIHKSLSLLYHLRHLQLNWNDFFLSFFSVFFSFYCHSLVCLNGEFSQLYMLSMLFFVGILSNMFYTTGERSFHSFATLNKLSQEIRLQQFHINIEARTQSPTYMNEILVESESNGYE